MFAEFAYPIFEQSIKEYHIIDDAYQPTKNPYEKGSIEHLLFAKTKIAHSRRVFCLDQSVKKHLILKDLDKGLEIYLRNEDSTHKETEKFNTLISSMYI